MDIVAEYIRLTRTAPKVLVPPALLPFTTGAAGSAATSAASAAQSTAEMVSGQAQRRGDCWIALDFGSMHLVNVASVFAQHSSKSPEHMLQAFEVHVSQDAKRWTVIADVSAAESVAAAHAAACARDASSAAFKRRSATRHVTDCGIWSRLAHAAHAPLLHCLLCLLATTILMLLLQIRPHRCNPALHLRRVAAGCGAGVHRQREAASAGAEAAAALCRAVAAKCDRHVVCSGRVCMEPISAT